MIIDCEYAARISRKLQAKEKYLRGVAAGLSGQEQLIVNARAEGIQDARRAIDLMTLQEAKG